MTDPRKAAAFRAEIGAVLADWARQVDHGEPGELAGLFTGDAADPLPLPAGKLAPVLVLNGSLDVPGYREIAACLHRESGVEPHELACAGHLLNLERAATFNHHVLGFLACLDCPALPPCRTGSDLAACRCPGPGH